MNRLKKISGLFVVNTILSNAEGSLSRIQIPNRYSEERERICPGYKS